MISIKASTRFRIAVSRTMIVSRESCLLLFLFLLIVFHILSSWNDYIILYFDYAVNRFYNLF